MQLFDRAAEMKVMQKLAEVRDMPIGWQAIHFHLSQLMDEYKNEYQSKIAINLMHDLLKKCDGGIYLLENNDIIVILFKLEKAVQDKLIFQIRYLYMDDPLAYNSEGQENPDLCTVYELKHSWKAFYEVYSRYMQTARRGTTTMLGKTIKQPEPRNAMRPQSQITLRQDESAELELVAPKLPPEPKISDEPAAKTAPEPDKHAIDHKLQHSLSGLATIESALRHIDLTSAIRRQPVCAVLPNMTVRRVFDELYIFIAQLRQSMGIDSDFFSNRWLFKYVTRILDERVLQMIREKPRQFLKEPVSININVETLLSSWFTEFDAAIDPASRISIVFEIPVVDVYADMAAFQLARQEVQRLGYRVCLDGLTTSSFTSINRERLGLDIVKVQWNADGHSDINSKENKELAEAVQHAGSNRVILCRCDNRSAVEFGHALGISLFQGRFIDSVLDPTSKVNN